MSWGTPSPPDPVHGAGVDPEFSAASLIRRFDFARLRSIVFDQMLPEIANHRRRDGVEALMTGAGLEDVRLAWVNENSWAAIAGSRRDKVPEAAGLDQRREGDSPLLLTAGAWVKKPRFRATIDPRRRSFARLSLVGQALGVAISEFSPAFIQAYNTGAALFQTGRFDEAATVYRRLIDENPDIATPHAATLHGVLGLCLRAAGRPDEAMEPLRQALRLKPDHLDALNALGGILLERRHIEHALIAFRELVKLKPDYPGALLTLGNLFMFSGEAKRARAAYRLAILAEPHIGTNHNNLGAVTLSLGRPHDAALHYRRALVLEVGRPEYRKNLGTCLLMAGDYANGTVAYEGRLEQGVWRKRNMPGVLWQGQPLAGKTLLVHFEQGLGDSFQYIRYAGVLKRRGARVLYECQPALKRVLSTAPDLDGLFALGEPLPAYDYHISLMSLMHRLGTTPDSVPGGVPYIRAEPQLQAGWAERLDRLEGGNRPALRIGINWHGNETGKSIPLDCFEAIGKLPGVRLYSLQKVSGLDHLERLRDRVAVTELGAEFDAGPDAFLDTAAVMANLDLVVTCDTSVCHLAGAMGRPVWVVLKWFADWRWMRDRLDSPWYPTMRLFRQARAGDWAEVMARVTAEVTAARDAGIDARAQERALAEGGRR